MCVEQSQKGSDISLISSELPAALASPLQELEPELEQGRYKQEQGQGREDKASLASFQQPP